MEVILKQDVPNLGKIGELVKVKPGYARNFLVPRDLALPAGAGQKKNVEHHKRMIDAIKKRVQKESQEKVASFTKITLKLEKRFNESGKMFGSVTAQDLVALLSKEGFVFDRRDIGVELIKEPGVYEVQLRLPGDVMTTCKLDLKATADSEAKPAKKGPRAKSTGATKAKKMEEAEAGEETPSE